MIKPKQNEIHWIIVSWRDKFIPKSGYLDEHCEKILKDINIATLPKPFRQNKAISCMSYILYNLMYENTK